MTPAAKWFLILGSLNACLSVILGAFGAHALEEKLSADMMSTYQTGVQYHFYHALGLFAVAFAAAHLPSSRLVRWSGWTLLAGIILFSGSLYTLSLSGVRWIGAITPIGGACFIIAWALLAIAALKQG
jgi:uncharacterized membrane protein YgdD (TMEM256/DUF423 family)